ncbi:DUF2244 domain-containing protein [Sphingomonas changnyeongensis]|uniref:DUF2244 domain-containing protein n=1 Tax=Sphingomonas changnyeongensis TaxID=2698679 RepID=A0A7Z2NXB0_9SPHN|nr:DUF2244 domain-containing protein [Sphingomonas changnyeongensis]QHL91151.1 DUF2244 domain-containing protein [Sphingomonas changnyeongensis]
MSWAEIGPWGSARRTDTEIRMIAPRSAMPVQGRYMLIAASIAAAIMSARFVMIGAWPVMIFAVLDIGALVVALHVFARRPVPEERLALVDGRIELTRIDHQGRRARLALPAFWTRLETSGRTELDCDLWLVFRGRRHPVAQCVAAAERRALIPRIEALLARGRHQ